MTDLAFWKDLGETLESFATVAALGTGAVWTYLTFVRQRLGLPRLEIALSTQEIGLGSKCLLRVQVDLRNSGTVVATSDKAELRLREVVPLPAEIDAMLAQEKDPVPSNRAHVEWPLLFQRNWTFQTRDFEIEPGESDVLFADFFIGCDTRVVELYFYIANAAKPLQNIGWTRSLIYRLSGEGATYVERSNQEISVSTGPTAPTASATHSGASSPEHATEPEAATAAASIKEEVGRSG